jgi:hypothetical protein
MFTCSKIIALKWFVVENLHRNDVVIRQYMEK